MAGMLFANACCSYSQLTQYHDFVQLNGSNLKYNPEFLHLCYQRR